MILKNLLPHSVLKNYADNHKLIRRVVYISASKELRLDFGNRVDIWKFVADEKTQRETWSKIS